MKGGVFLLKQTLIANLIDKTDVRAQYDEEAKRLLSLSEILAWILHTCVDEFKEFDIPFIVKNCLVDKPIISEKAVYPDMQDKQQYIETMNSESSTISENTIYYDIRFKVRAPKADEIIEIIVDIEEQKDSSFIKRIIRRGLYYCSRMISEQYGREFQNEEYEKIKKVISIWICPSAANIRQDSIFEIHNTSNVIYGSYEVDENYYDISRVIIICLTDNGQSEQKLIRLLSVYLSDKTTPEEKKYILEHEFNIKMTEEMERGIENMYAFSNVLLERNEQELKTRIAANLLNNTLLNNSDIARATELSEDVVRKIAAIVAEEKKSSASKPL